MTATGFNTSFGAPQYANLNSSLTSERKAQPEYKKIFCAYHSTEFLTNFCTDSKHSVTKRSVSCLFALPVSSNTLRNIISVVKNLHTSTLTMHSMTLVSNATRP